MEGTVVEKSQLTLFEKCKYCRYEIDEEPLVNQYVGVCTYCEESKLMPKTQKRKKKTYNLG